MDKEGVYEYTSPKNANSYFWDIYTFLPLNAKLTIIYRKKKHVLDLNGRAINSPDRKKWDFKPIIIRKKETALFYLKYISNKNKPKNIKSVFQGFTDK